MVAPFRLKSTVEIRVLEFRGLEFRELEFRELEFRILEFEFKSIFNIILIIDPTQTNI